MTAGGRAATSPPRSGPPGARTCRAPACPWPPAWRGRGAGRGAGRARAGVPGGGASTCGPAGPSRAWARWRRGPRWWRSTSRTQHYLHGLSRVRELSTAGESSDQLSARCVSLTLTPLTTWITPSLASSHYLVLDT